MQLRCSRSRMVLCCNVGYIAYDTHLMVQRYDLDQYIWAAVGLYLDIINLFLRLLQLLNGGRR